MSQGYPVKKLIFLLMVFALMGLHSEAATASTDESDFQLTVELRDGSRVIGKGLGDPLNFHSTAMGDFKMTWAGINSVEFSTTATESAQLTATNGDVYEVRFLAPTVTLDTGFGKNELPVKLIRSIKVFADGKPNKFTKSSTIKGTDLQMTVELRDGSRIIGKTSDHSLDYHSDTLGDMKLPWSDIRAVKFDANTAHLTAINGDCLSVQVSTDTLHLQTSFGKIDLPVKLIRSINVSTSTINDSHLVGWWKLDDGNGTAARDSSSGAHDGNLMNGPQWVQDSGQSGMCLQFNGSNQYVDLGNILQGSYSEISIACWVKSDGTGKEEEIVGRGVWDGPDGIGLESDNRLPSASFGHWALNAGATVVSKANVLDNQWHHLAGTISQNDSGYTYRIYVDGQLENTASCAMGLTATTNGWTIGARFKSDCNGLYAYKGLIKDVRIYDCALSAADVQAIYAEQNNGKPSAAVSPRPIPPVSVRPDIKE
jgi:hypothetical protein